MWAVAYTDGVNETKRASRWPGSKIGVKNCSNHPLKTFILQWPSECEMGNNPRKIEVFLFTSSITVNTHLSVSWGFMGRTWYSIMRHIFWDLFLTESRPGKYNWYRTVSNTFYTCKKVLKSGLRPKLTIWIYTEVIRPMLSYGSLIWWNYLSWKTNYGMIQRLQRSALL